MHSSTLLLSSLQSILPGRLTATNSVLSTCSPLMLELRLQPPSRACCSLFLWVNCCLCSLKDHHNCRLCWNTFDTKSPLLESLQPVHSDSPSHQDHQLWKQSCSLCSLWTPILSCPMSDAPSREAQVCEMQIFTCNSRVSLWARKINAWHTCCHLPVSYDLYRLMPLASQ